MNSDKPIYVTQPHLPPLEDFIPYLSQIWKNKILTNGGPFHQQLESALCEYLGVRHLSLFSNGTLALLVALQTLKVTGEVITTPYSFVATAHSLLWNGLRPVFVDIDPITLNMDPNRVEEAITAQTTAIMPVHVYGQSCDVKSIQSIADKHSLKVIYDGAHAFSVQDEFGSILNHGDLTTLSFHATKVFNTFEGGAIVCKDAQTKMRVDHLKNFGFLDELTVIEPGINAKMSEINAAFGLLQLNSIESALSARRKIAAHYLGGLSKVTGITCVLDNLQSNFNFGYFPILVNQNFLLSRDDLFEKLKANLIVARRYFFPLISNFPMYRDTPSASPQNLPQANKIANKVICLPIYPGLPLSKVDKIIELISE